MGFLEGAPLELLLVFIIALIVLGPEGLPDFARKVGGFIREARRMVNEVTQEFRQEFATLDQAREEMKRLAALPTDTIKSAFAPLPQVGAGSADGSADKEDRELDPSALYYGASVEPAPKTEIETALEGSGRKISPPEFTTQEEYVAPDVVNDYAATAAQPDHILPTYQPQFGLPIETTVIDAHDLADSKPTAQADDIYIGETEFYPMPTQRTFDAPDDAIDEANTGMSDFAKAMMQKSRSVSVPIADAPAPTSNAPRKMRVAGRHGLQGRTARREEQHER